MTGTVYSIQYVFFGIPSSRLIANTGTYFPICLSVILTVIGTWLKCLINRWFY